MLEGVSLGSEICNVERREGNDEKKWSERDKEEKQDVEKSKEGRGAGRSREGRRAGLSLISRLCPCHKEVELKQKLICFFT